MKYTIYFIALSVLGTIFAESNQMNSVYGVVLAGGSGERLWPLSRQSRPKQFLCLGSEKTLLEQSIDRLRLLPDIDFVFVTSAQSHVSPIMKHVGNRIDTVIAEPMGRNTGPAILYTCFELYKKDPDALVVFVPSDAFIPESDNALFCRYVQRMIRFISTHDSIALLGVHPTHAATGYGYIEYNINERILSMCKVNRFCEKPSCELASNYIKQGNMLWNIGMFGARVSVFIEEFKRHAPDMFQAMEAYIKGEGSYEDIPAVAVDYAVIEKSDNTWVLPVDFSWCDVGNLEMFLSIKYLGQNSMKNMLQVDACNSLVDVPDKLVALIGVDDLCVVDTGDTLLISKRSDVEKVREVVAQLKQNNQTEYL